MVYLLKKKKKKLNFGCISYCLRILLIGMSFCLGDANGKRTSIGQE